jgi:hypothetical protein
MNTDKDIENKKEKRGKIKKVVHNDKQGDYPDFASRP